MVLFEDIEWYNICEPTEFADFGCQPFCTQKRAGWRCFKLFLEINDGKIITCTKWRDAHVRHGPERRENDRKTDFEQRKRKSFI